MTQQAEGSQRTPEAVLTAPERIWLQIGDESDYLNEPFPHSAGEEITWCQDSVVAAEVAYVRADLADNYKLKWEQSEACSTVINRQRAELVELREQLAAMKAYEQDALRYRWLRTEATRLGWDIAVSVTFNIGHDWIQHYDFDAFDAAIDAAIAAAKP